MVEIDAEKMRLLREERVLSQRELARLAGITHTTLWRLENGFRVARPKTIRKLAKALEVEPKELLKRGQDGQEAQ